MQKNKSIFVDVLGWLMIVLSAGAMLISIGQNIIINFVFPSRVFESIAQNGGGPDSFSSSIFQNIRIIFAIIALIILYALIISIAFLKRKDWGRIGLILLFGIIIMYNIGSLIVQWTFISSVESESPSFDSDFGKITTIIKVFTAIFVLGLSVLLGWLIKKLSSKKIAAEFKANTKNQEQLPMNDLNEKKQNTDEDTRFWLYDGEG